MSEVFFANITGLVLFYVVGTPRTLVNHNTREFVLMLLHRIHHHRFSKVCQRYSGWYCHLFHVSQCILHVCVRFSRLTLNS